MMGDIRTMDKEMLRQRRGHLEEMRIAEYEAFDQIKQFTEEGYNRGAIGHQEYLDQIYNNQLSHDARLRDIDKKYVQNSRRLFDEENKLRKNASDYEIQQRKERMDKVLDYLAENLSLSREEIEKIWNEDMNLEKPIRNMIDATADASQELTNAVSDWGSLMTDFSLKIGKNVEDINFDDVINNLDDFKQSVIDAGLTWNDLKLLKKEGKMDAETKQFLDKAMKSQEFWNSMTLDEILAFIGVDQQGIEDMRMVCENLGVDWNDLQLKVHEAEINGDNALETIESLMTDMINFNGLSIEEKKAIVEDLATPALQDAITKQELWNNSEFLDKLLNIITTAPDAEAEIRNMNEAFGQIPEGTKVLKTETNAGETHSEVSKLILFWLAQKLLGKVNLEAVDKASEPAKQATDSATEFSNGDYNGELNATDNTSDAVSSATSASEGYADGDYEATLNAKDNTASPVAEATNASNKFANGKYQGNLTADASGALRGARTAIQAMNSVPRSRTSYIDIITRRKTIRLAKGTSHHRGGLAVLGDGGRREPFLTPHGHFGISPNKDTLYSLPKGTKVWPSIGRLKNEASRYSKFKDLLQYLPKFAHGTDQSFLNGQQKMVVPKGFNESSPVDSSVNNNINLEVHLQVVGSSLSRTQADNIIQPLLEAGERYAKKTNNRFNLGVVTDGL